MGRDQCHCPRDRRFLLGGFVWFVLLLIGLAWFGEHTPECTDSDTCGAWGDFLYNWWPGNVTCLVLGAAVTWALLRPMRR